MDSDDDALMMDVEPIPTIAKGKAKAFDRERPYDNENLPW
jgi:replication factor C subunit 3/5